MSDTKCRTHLTMVIGETPDGKCDQCGTKTVLIVPGIEWRTVPDDDHAEDETWLEVSDEVSAHYCPECDRITSLSFNAKP